MHYCIDSCIPILNENFKKWSLISLLSIDITLFSSLDFFQLLKMTVYGDSAYGSPAYKAIMQCTNEQLCYNFNFNLFLLKLSTWRYMRYIYTNINKCRYSVRGTWTVQIREKIRKKYKCSRRADWLKNFLHK